MRRWQPGYYAAIQRGKLCRFAAAGGPGGAARLPEADPGRVAVRRDHHEDGSATRSGWMGSSAFQAAYNLPSLSKGSGQIVAIVDAYDDPNVASDLAEYRSYFGLPPANFTKYNQEGQQGNYPPTCLNNDNWCAEIDLDVEMVSAVCPNCTIYLVEANDGDSLGTAEKEAVKLGAHIISNSWSWGPISKSDFDAPGVVYLVAAGDSTYGVEPPAWFPTVISVGGTMLAKRGSKYKEIVWPLTGAGCAKHFEKPSWQHDPDCPWRTDNDVAAVAWDVAEYDSYNFTAG